MSTHGVTDAQVDAVLASRHTGEDGQDAGGEAWYRNPELRTLWGDEFSAMHALAQAVKSARESLHEIKEWALDRVDGEVVDGRLVGNDWSSVVGECNRGLGVRDDA